MKPDLDDKQADEGRGVEEERQRRVKGEREQEGLKGRADTQRNERQTHYDCRLITMHSPAITGTRLGHKAHT